MAVSQAANAWLTKADGFKRVWSTRKKKAKRERASWKIKALANRVTDYPTLVLGLQKFWDSIMSTWRGDRACVASLGEYILLCLTVVIPPVRKSMYLDLAVHGIHWDSVRMRWYIMLPTRFKNSVSSAVDRLALVSRLVEPMALYLRHRHVLRCLPGAVNVAMHEATLFVREDGTRHSAASALGIFREFGREYCDITALGPHILRDHFITHYCRDRPDITKEELSMVATQMGTTSSMLLKHYLHLMGEATANAVADLLDDKVEKVLHDMPRAAPARAAVDMDIADVFFDARRRVRQPNGDAVVVQQQLEAVKLQPSSVYEGIVERLRREMPPLPRTVSDGSFIIMDGGVAVPAAKPQKPRRSKKQRGKRKSASLQQAGESKAAPPAQAPKKPRGSIVDAVVSYLVDRQQAADKGQQCQRVTVMDILEYKASNCVRTITKQQYGEIASQLMTMGSKFYVRSTTGQKLYTAVADEKKGTSKINKVTELWSALRTVTSSTQLKQIQAVRTNWKAVAVMRCADMVPVFEVLGCKEPKHVKAAVMKWAQ